MIERVVACIEHQTEKQCGLRNGGECMDKVFPFKSLSEKNKRKERFCMWH